MHFFILTQTIKLPTKYYDPRTTNHVMLLHTHKDHTDNINLLEIAKEFVSFNDRRINLFGHF